MENKFTIEDVAAFWDKIADQYEKHHEKENIEDVHFQRFCVATEYLDPKPKDKILNIWSRTGEAIPFLRKKQPDIDLYNLEASTEFIKIAREHFPSERFAQTDLEKLPFSDNYFDTILSLETLEHVPRPIIFTGELYRVLKPDGYLIMSLPPASAELPLRVYELLFPNHGEGPHKFLAPRRVKKILKKSGFKLKLHRGTLLLPAGPKFLKDAAEKIIEIFQWTPIKNLGIRQFYICEK